MIGGVILALLGAAAIIVAMFAQNFGAAAEQVKKIQQVGWILGIILLIAGGGWIAVNLYKKGSDETQETITQQTAYQIAQNEGNPDVIAANTQAYNDCYNNCINTASWSERNLGRKRLNARCNTNCK